MMQRSKTAEPVSEFENYLHLMRGQRMTGRMPHRAVSRVVMVRDSLMIGPSHNDSKQHARTRLGFWDSLEVAFGRRSTVRAERQIPDALVIVSQLEWLQPDEPIAVWIGENPADSLFLWWLCSTLPQSALERRVVVTAQIGPYSLFTLNEAQESLQQAQPLDANRRDLYASFWQHFVAGHLDELSSAAERDTTARIVVDAMQCFLPRRTEGRFWLSYYDAELLGEFSMDDASLVSRAVGNICLKMPWLGDMITFARIHEWERHSSNAILCATKAKRWNQKSYQLTEAGRAILETGLSSPSSAPEIATGGTVAYASSGWAVADDADGEFVRY